MLTLLKDNDLTYLYEHHIKKNEVTSI